MPVRGSFSKRTFRVLAPDGGYSSKHSNPAQIDFSGRLSLGRPSERSQVVITDTFGPATRVIDETTVASQIQTIAPAKIVSNLRKLCNDWNIKVELVRNYDLGAQLTE